MALIQKFYNIETASNYIHPKYHQNIISEIIKKDIYPNNLIKIMIEQWEFDRETIQNMLLRTMIKIHAQQQTNLIQQWYNTGNTELLNNIEDSSHSDIIFYTIRNETKCVSNEMIQIMIKKLQTCNFTYNKLYPEIFRSLKTNAMIIITKNNTFITKVFIPLDKINVLHTEINNTIDNHNNYYKTKYLPEELDYYIEYGTNFININKFESIVNTLIKQIIETDNIGIVPTNIITKKVKVKPINKNQKDTELIMNIINELTKNVMDSTLTVFITEFITVCKNYMDIRNFMNVLKCLKNNGWDINDFNQSPNKQKLINDLYDICEQFE